MKASTRPPLFQFRRSKSEDTLVSIQEETLPDNSDDPLMMMSSSSSSSSLPAVLPLPSCMKKKKNNTKTKEENAGEEEEEDTNSVVSSIVVVVVDSSSCSSSLELTMSVNETAAAAKKTQQRQQQQQERTKTVRFSLGENENSNDEDEEEKISIIGSTASSSATSWVLTKSMKQRLWWSNSEMRSFRIRRDKAIARECTRGMTLDNIERMYDACRLQQISTDDGNSIDNCITECISLCSSDGRGLENQIHPAFGYDQQLLRDEILKVQKNFNNNEISSDDERQVILASISLRRSRHHKIFARLVAKGDAIALLPKSNNTIRTSSTRSRRFAAAAAAAAWNAPSILR